MYRWFLDSEEIKIDSNELRWLIFGEINARIIRMQSYFAYSNEKKRKERKKRKKEWTLINFTAVKKSLRFNELFNVQYRTHTKKNTFILKNKSRERKRMKEINSRFALQSEKERRYPNE